MYIREADLSGKDRGATGERLGGLVKNVCTPSFDRSPTNALTLAWSESDAKGKWELRSTSLVDNSPNIRAELTQAAVIYGTDSAVDRAVQATQEVQF